jgi:hypothetical protein
MPHVSKIIIIIIILKTKPYKKLKTKIKLWDDSATPFLGQNNLTVFGLCVVGLGLLNRSYLPDKKSSSFHLKLRVSINL